MINLSRIIRGICDLEDKFQIKYFIAIKTILQFGENKQTSKTKLMNSYSGHYQWNIVLSSNDCIIKKRSIF